MPCGCLKPKCGSQSAVNFVCENDGRDVEFISLAEFLPRVTLIAKGVPDDVALEYLPLSQTTKSFCKKPHVLMRKISFTFATLPFQPKMRAKWINSCLTAITMWWSTVHWHNCF